MQISKRLKAVSGMVTSGLCLADIGTDHGYIPIYLVQSGRVPRAIAMDVNRGPLLRAREHIAQYGLSDRIETRLSDGLQALTPGEAESIVIAGMGGPLTVRILEEGEAVLAGCRELILQPQSEIRQVREYLEQKGYVILEEDMILEEGKFYPMMRAVKSVGSRKKMSEPELCYGPVLLEKKHPVLREYLNQEEKLKLRVLEALKGKGTEGAVKRRLELSGELEQLHRARKLL